VDCRDILYIMVKRRIPDASTGYRNPYFISVLDSYLYYEIIFFSNTYLLYRRMRWKDDGE
jgi:hypothetical protein